MAEMTDSPRWSRRLHAALDAADARAKKLAGGLTVEQLNWHAEPAIWSIGQCLDHLRVANVVYGRAIEEALTRPPTGPVDEITPGWFGRWFIRTQIEPSASTKKGKAPKKIVPMATVDATILDQFLKSNNASRQLLDRAQAYDVNRVRFVNPFVSMIRFTIGTGFEILTKHEDRHLLQAERVKAHPNFPAA
jgi:hypothetical protein